MRLFRFKTGIPVTAVALAAVLYAGSGHFTKPRVLAVDEVPIAFWSWRTQSPADAEVRQDLEMTNAGSLFLRAGQLDLVDGEIKCIRPVIGTLPSSVELHLVYNATRDLLREWEEADKEKMADAVAAVYLNDLASSRLQNVGISGLQLDLDVPTRLLPGYAEMLRRLREKLPPETKLSITGLPTWAASQDLYPVLDAVDFWIPQIYGTKVPMRVTDRIPISSPIEVEHFVKKIRGLNRPFYAGLSAYSYAILYAKDGSLLEMRGDLDPGLAAHNAGLELVRTQTFTANAEASEVRYEYRAKSDLVLDGLIINAGETLVFDLPTSASLRASARAVRENAGESLLGICLFRLPTAEDKTTLSIAEIAAAIKDTKTKAATAITAEAISKHQIELRAKNTGTAATMLSENSLVIDIDIPAGSIGGVLSLSGFASYETLCRISAAQKPLPCSRHRANMIRLKAREWKPGAEAAITFGFRNKLPTALPVSATSYINDGRMERESFELQIQNRRE